MAQSTVANLGGNTWGAANFLGWNGIGGSNTLRFKTFNTDRMQIYDAAAASNSGCVGIGDFVTAGATPQSLLHLMVNQRTDVFSVFTNSNTGKHNASDASNHLHNHSREQK
ncbi:hypothetical protein BH11BAC1_BH11BAC1_04680 [soil metagenome]